MCGLRRNRVLIDWGAIARIVPVLSVRFRINLRVSWLVRIVNRASFLVSAQYQNRPNYFQAFSLHGVVSLNCTVKCAIKRYITMQRECLVRDRYPLSCCFSSLCICSNAHPTCLSHASVPSVMCPVEFGNGSAGGNTSASFKVFIATNSSSFSSPDFVGWSFPVSYADGAAIRAKFGTKRQKILHMSKKNVISVILVCFSIRRIELVVWKAILRCLGSITWPRQSLFFVKNWYFLRFRVTPAILRVPGLPQYDRDVLALYWWI